MPKRAKRNRRAKVATSKKRGASKRAATIRKGFRYQDLIAACSMLDMLIGEDSDGPIAVSLEHAPAGAFDDIVERYTTEVVCKQVKWAANSLGEPLTIDGLAKSPKAGAKSLIARFAASWKAPGGNELPCRLRLVTNRAPDLELRRFLTGDTTRIRADLSAADRKRLDTAWRAETGLSRPIFAQFLVALELDASLPSLQGMEARVREKLQALHIPADMLHAVMSAIHGWATDSSKDRVTAADVTSVLRVHEGGPSNVFRIDQATLVDRSTVQGQLAHLVTHSGGKYVVLLGTAGSGKSTILNTIAPGSALAHGHHVLVYNCFTGPGDTHLRTRATVENVLRFLHRELRSRLESRWTSRFAPGDQLESVLNLASTITDKPLVIVVDGLDYAVANRPLDGTGVAEELPPTLPSNVTVVISAQTKEQLPERLRRLPSSQYLQAPPLSVGQTKRLLAKSGVFVKWNVTDSDEQECAAQLHKRTEGHALSIAYAASWLKQDHAPTTSLATALDALPKRAPRIEDWYQSLPGLKSALARRLVGTAAASPSPLTIGDFRAILTDPVPEHALEDELAALAFLFTIQDGAYQFRHDSLRMHGLSHGNTGVHTPGSFFDHLLATNQRCRMAEYGMALAIEAGRTDWAVDNIDGHWLADALADGARRQVVEDGLQALLEDAVSRRAWPEMSKWSMLLHLTAHEVRTATEGDALPRAWVACGHEARALRQIMSGDDLRFTPESALTAAERLADDAAVERIERLAAATPIELHEGLSYTQWRDRVLHYVPHVAKMMPVSDCFDELKRIAERSARLDLWPRQPSKDELLGEMARHAAWGCLAGRQFDRVREWLTRRTLFSRDESAMLRAANDLLDPDATTEERAIQRGLLPSSPLWLLRRASERPSLKPAVRTAMERRPLPCRLVAVHFERTDRALLESMTRDACADIQLSHTLGLNDRLKQIAAAVPPAPRHSNRFLFGLAVETSQALATASDWTAAAAAFTSAFVAAEREPGGRDAWYDMYCMDGIALLVRRIGHRAGSDRKRFAEWIDGVLLPLLNEQRLGHHDETWAIVRTSYLPAAGSSHRKTLLDHLEAEADRGEFHKTDRYLELAEAAGFVGDAVRGASLVGKAMRAAFTYGYRKDITLLEFTNCIAALGAELKPRMSKVMALCGSALEVLEELTDHKGINDTGTEIVVAAALTNPPLAVHFMSALSDRVRSSFFRKSLALALRDRGIDPETVVEHFRRSGQPIRFWSPSSARHPLGAPWDLPSAFEPLCKELEVSQGDEPENWERQRELKYRLMATAVDAKSFDRVRVFLKSVGGGRYWTEPMLARRASQIGLRPQALALARGIIEPRLRGDALGWYQETDEAFAVMADCDVGAAWSAFEALCDKTVEDGGRYWGPYLAPTVLRLLHRSGRAPEALACFDVFEAYLRQLLAPYPSHEARLLAKLES